MQEVAVVKETLPLVLPSTTDRPVATAAQAANQSTAAAPTAPLLESNHTAGLSGAPVITPYLPNDHVFVGTSLFADIHWYSPIFSAVCLCILATPIFMLSENFAFNMTC